MAKKISPRKISGLKKILTPKIGVQNYFGLKKCCPKNVGLKKIGQKNFESEINFCKRNE